MMNPAISAAAREWVIRTQHPEFEDWDGLGSWMSKDVRHADEFNRLSLLDQDIAEAVAASPPPRGEVVALRPPTRFGWRGWALAASFVLVAVPTGLFIRHGNVGSQPARAVAVVTRPGETRTLALPDGTSIAVAGGSSLTIDKAARHVEMDRGLATFSVVHDAARPFAVTVGAVTVTDVGTVFEIRRRNDESMVSVGKGEVRVESRARPVRLVAGQQFRLSSRETSETGTMSDGSVGQWQRGVLEYDGATIAEIAADIQDLTGVQVSASRAVANRRFAGTITLAGDPGRALQHVAPLLGVTPRRHGDAWTLEPPSNAIGR